MINYCFHGARTRAALKRPKTLQQICRECFYEVFEEEIHRVIVDNQLFKPGERIAVGASGGKDSTVLAYVMSELNRRHNYGLDLFLLSVDEGITGYRDDSLETVKRNEIQALDRGAALLKVDKLVTGHNADDIAETVLLNILRGDIASIQSSGSILSNLSMVHYRPRSILDIIKSGEDFRISTTTKMPEQGNCERCGYISSQKWCKACVLLDGLNRGLPKLGIGRSRGLNSDHTKNTKQANGTKNLQSKQCGSLDF
nr:cytoplasmic tRNA 2-thiolation protein 1 [Ipomoea batatas]